MEPKIVFEDKDVLIIDKPCQMVVNRAESVREETVQDWVEKRLPFLKKERGEFGNRSGVVHRIDKETSGLLIIAKNKKSYLFLKKQFSQRKVVKKYIALVHGKMRDKKGVIEVGIRRNPRNRRRFMVDLTEGKRAKTNYQVIRYYKTEKGRKLTLVEVMPVTGRTHQIRVHFKFINHSLVSDRIYGGEKQLRRDLLFCPRLFLHASYLSLFHPRNKVKKEFFSSLPKELTLVLKEL